MKPGFAARRGAEEFNSLVEGTSVPDPGSARYADFLELVTSLRTTTPVQPRSEFVADLRGQLLTEAATVLTPATARLTVAPRRGPRERRIAIAIGGFAVIGATTSMAMAAQTALPGDTLYPLKRALENANTTIQIDEDAKGASLLDHASGRLDEVGELTRQGDESNAEAVADTLHAFADQATSASELLIAAYTSKGQESDIEELRAFAAQSMAALNDLEAMVPASARAALIEAAQVISMIDTAAIRLCPSCGDGAAQTAEFDAAASVEDALGSLGSALASPLTTLADQHPAGRQPAEDSPQASSEDAPQPPRRGPQGEPIAVPDGPGEVTNSGEIEGGAGAEGREDRSAIKDLTDRLTGRGERTPRNNTATLGDVISEALEHVGDGLFGK